MSSTVRRIPPSSPKKCGAKCGARIMAENRKRKGKHPEKVLTATRVRSVAEPGRYIDGNGLYLEVEAKRSYFFLIGLISWTSGSGQPTARGRKSCSCTPTNLRRTTVGQWMGVSCCSPALQ